MNEKLHDLLEYVKTLKRYGAAATHRDYPLLVELTHFLPSDSTVSRRLWHLINDTWVVPMCTQCGVNHAVWRSSNRGYYGISCSSECSAKNPERLNRIRSSNMKKYGTDFPLGSAAIRKKAATTIRDKYGVENISQLSSTKQKVSTALFNRKNKNAHNSEAIKDLIMQGCTQREIGEVIGISQERVSSLLKRLGVRTSTITGSQIQREMCKYIRDELQLDVVEDDISVLSPRHIDILIPSLSIGVEVNGLYWHSEIAGRNKQYHITKTKQCASKNIHLMQFYDTEWCQQQELVKSIIRNATHLNTNRVYARNTVVLPVDVATERSFLEQNHLQGYVASEFCVGLFYNGNIVSLMSFGKSRYSKLADIELLRFANATNTSVIGGAAKLFKTFVAEANPTKIISYCNRRVFSGSLYLVLGFNQIGESAPSYKYFNRSGDTTKLLSRVQFQKHKLSKKLAVFDPTLSEWENMRNNGYDRIWDCGNMIFLWECK